MVVATLPLFRRILVRALLLYTIWYAITSNVFSHLLCCTGVCHNAQIQNVGMPENLSPLVFAFTGDGNVSQGAQEIFNLFPHEYIQASELAELGE